MPEKTDKQITGATIHLERLTKKFGKVIAVDEGIP